MKVRLRLIERASTRLRAPPAPAPAAQGQAPLGPGTTYVYTIEYRMSMCARGYDRERGITHRHTHGHTPANASRPRAKQPRSTPYKNCTLPSSFIAETRKALESGFNPCMLLRALNAEVERKVGVQQPQQLEYLLVHLCVRRSQVETDCLP